MNNTRSFLFRRVPEAGDHCGDGRQRWQGEDTLHWSKMVVNVGKARIPCIGLKITLPGVTTRTFNNKVGETSNPNFQVSAPGSETGNTYGTLDMTLTGPNGEVQLGYYTGGVSPAGLVMDRYDFNHNPGQSFRNWAADRGRPEGNGVAFDIHGYGHATVPVLPDWNMDIRR